MNSIRKFTIGNVVRINGNIHKITAITAAGVTAKDTESGYTATYPYDEIKPIPLSDRFFKDNGYKFDKKYQDKHERYITHIIPGDYTGPAVTKYEYEPWRHQDTEYCVTGIIIRTVDEFQNLMNICRCSFIADKMICK